MTVQSALNGLNSILAVISKGDADPATKLLAIQDLANVARNDIQDLADQEYSSYLPDRKQPTFDMKKAVDDLYEPLSKQIYFNLYDYYHRTTLMDEPDPFIRVALCQALMRCAVDQKQEPNPLWAAVIQCDGELDEVSE